MRTLSRIVAFVTLTLAPLAYSADKPFPNFRVQEIDHTLKVGYAVLLTDINGDGKPDIVVVDTTRVIWFENPTWQMHVILQGQTLPDNVCIDAIDIDGDGKPDLVLGAGWKGTNTKDESTVQWLSRGKDVNEPWTLHPIGKEVDIHRIHVADVDGTGKPQIFVAPLMGKGATAKANWMDSAVRLLKFSVPKDPIGGTWEPVVACDEFHVMHNFTPVHWEGEKQISLLVASYEGVHLLRRQPDGKFASTPIGAGNQEDLAKSRGSSEVKMGRGPGGKPVIATIEPWHGNQVVVYTPPASGQGLWDRQVLDDKLKGGHGVWFADLDGDGVDELIIGSRDAFNAEMGPGVYVYKAESVGGTKWEKHVIDNKGVAAEDLAAIDLNGDGKIDIVAVGRGTHNVRIYWNESK
jgi:hypothetical protein